MDTFLSGFKSLVLLSIFIASCWWQIRIWGKFCSEYNSYDPVGSFIEEKSCRALVGIPAVILFGALALVFVLALCDCLVAWVDPIRSFDPTDYMFFLKATFLVGLAFMAKNALNAVLTGATIYWGANQLFFHDEWSLIPVFKVTFDFLVGASSDWVIIAYTMFTILYAVGSAVYTSLDL